MKRTLSHSLAISLVIAGATLLSACCTRPQKTTCPTCATTNRTNVADVTAVRTTPAALKAPATKGLDLPAWAKMPPPVKALREVSLPWGKVLLFGGNLKQTISTRDLKVFQTVPFDFGPKSRLDEGSRIPLLVRGKTYWVAGTITLSKIAVTIPEGTRLYAFNNDKSHTGIAVGPVKVMVLNVVSDRTLVRLWVPNKGGASFLNMDLWIETAALLQSAAKKTIDKKWQLDKKYKKAPDFRFSLFQSPAFTLRQHFLAGSTCTWGVSEPSVKRGKRTKGWSQVILRFAAPLNI
ncbi:hypothetical protein KJ865_10655, partial [Myxococcota bacterium]|nr:hypothetical protein [Myxococcota bacterium]